MTLLTHIRGMPGQRSATVAAFTLVEVILAIFIAIGILVVLLYYYHQATELRTQVLQETENIGAARLILDRITGELRTAQSEPLFGRGFVGTSNSIEFVKTDVPSFAAWMGGALGRATTPVTDRKVVGYRLLASDGTNVTGLVRSEEALVPVATVTNLDQVDVETTNTVTSASAPPVIGEIRFLQFRYWGGTNWLDAWGGSAVPEAVEVSLGSEALTNSVEQMDSPPEIFRRVIYIGAPLLAENGSGSTNSDTNPAAVGPAEGRGEGTP